MATSISITRIAVALGGAAAIAWVIAVFPVFHFETSVNEVAQGVIAGEAFSPEVLMALDPLTDANSSLMVRSSMLSKAALIRLRQAEEASRSGDSKRAAEDYKSVERTVHEALRNAPSDSFLWLVLFLLDSSRDGARPDNLRFLRMSYVLGPNEGWIAIKRNAVAFANYPKLPNDLAESAISEFVALVRWGFVSQARDIASGPARPFRSILFPRLKELGDEPRRVFAGAIYERELDDVPVPGFNPPPVQIPMPVLPPKF